MTMDLEMQERARRIGFQLLDSSRPAIQDYVGEALDDDGPTEEDRYKDFILYEYFRLGLTK
jgi:hypothetical protein